MDKLTNQQLQSLRNMGNEAEAAADEIARLREQRADLLQCLTRCAESAFAEGQAGERERIRALVEAVRTENAAAQDDDDCVMYTPGLQRAWLALLAGLEGRNAAHQRNPTAPPFS
jgi:uncharacterized protein YukE